MKGGAKAARARRRGYEKKEAAWWAGHGFDVQLNWSEATFIPGRGFTPRAKDFFEKFDLVSVHPRFHIVAWVQVTESPMQGSGVHRNADHREPRWAWAPPFNRTVEEWVKFEDLESFRDARSVQVIVSYEDARHPVRKWWVPKEKGLGGGEPPRRGRAYGVAGGPAAGGVGVVPAPVGSGSDGPPGSPSSPGHRAVRQERWGEPCPSLGNLHLLLML